MMNEVTDSSLIAELEGNNSGLKPVDNPALIQELEGMPQKNKGISDSQLSWNIMKDYFDKPKEEVSKIWDSFVISEAFKDKGLKPNMVYDYYDDVKKEIISNPLSSTKYLNFSDNINKALDSTELLPYLMGKKDRLSPLGDSNENPMQGKSDVLSKVYDFFTKDVEGNKIKWSEFQPIPTLEAGVSLVGGAISFIPSLSAGVGELLQGALNKSGDEWSETLKNLFVPGYFSHQAFNKNDTGYVEILNESDWERAKAKMGEVGQALTYQPQTEMGKKETEALAYPFIEWSKGWREIAPKGQEDKYEFVGNALLLATPVLIKGLNEIPAFKDTTLYRQITIKERGLVPITDKQVGVLYDELVAKGVSEGELARTSDAFKQEAIKKRMTPEKATTPDVSTEQVSPIEQPVKQTEAIKTQEAKITAEQPVKTEELQLSDLEKMFEEDKSPEEFMQMLEGKEAIPSEKPSELPQEEALLKEPSAMKQEAPTLLEAKHEEVFNKSIDDLSIEEAKYRLTHDKLTGLKNREAFEKEGTTPYMGMLDLDGFKQVNDTFGHDAGDALLKEFAKKAQEKLGDKLYRLHGDEHAFKAMSEEEGYAIAKELDNIGKSATIVVERQGTKYLMEGVEFSYGIGKDFREADAKLYEHKAVREREGSRIPGSFPEGVRFVPPTEWSGRKWSEIQDKLQREQKDLKKSHLTFLKDWLKTKEGVVKLKDSEGKVVSRTKSDREQIFQDLSKEYKYSYDQIQNLLDRAINDKPLIDKPKTPASLEKAAQFIEDILAKTKDLYAKSEGAFLTSPETKTFKPKPIQQDMIGAKTGLEGKLPSEEIKGKTDLETATEEAQIREAQKGQGDLIEASLIEEAKKYKTAEEFVNKALQPKLAQDAGKKYADYGWRIEKRPISALQQSDFIEPQEWKTEYGKDLLRSAKKGELPAITIEPDGKIIDGNHRLEAYQKIGIKDVTVLVHDIKAKPGEISNLSQLIDIWNKANETKVEGTTPILESGGLQTLYETLMKKAKVPETAYSDLVELGKYVYEKGGNTASSWMKGMKEHLGKLWDTYKEFLTKIWNEIKKFAGNEKGFVRFGKEQPGDIKLSELDKQDELFKVGILEAYKAGKEAYTAGNKAGVEAEHIRMQNLLAARKERTELKTAINDLKNMVEKLTESPSVSADYRNKIKALIGEYELTGHYKSTIDKLQATQEYLDKVSAAGEDIEIPQRILNKLEILTRVPKDELTLNIVKGLKGEIELLGKLGKTKWASKQALYNAEKEARKTTLLDTATPINSKSTPQQPIGSDSKQWAEKYIKLRNYLQKTHVGLRPIDGLADITGMTPMKEALDLDYGNYLTYNDKAITKWYELTKDFSEGQLQRIGAVAIARQKGGLQRLTNIGRTEKEINEIKLTPAEEKAYQFVRAKFEEEFPAVKKYALDVYNADVGQVDNYVSFMSDYSAMSDLEIYERFGQRAEEITGRKTKTVEQGFKEKRSEISNIKLELNIDKIFRRHMDDVAYMLNMGRDVKQYFEIVNSPEMKAKLGDVGSLAWLQWLDLMARKGGTEGAKRIALLDLLRKNMGAGILAYRMSSFMVQFTSFADSMATIGPEWSFKGATSIATSKEWRNFIMDNFPEIKKAIGDDIAFREFGNGMFTNLTRAGMLPLQTFDALMRSTTAAGVYQKLAEEKGIEVNFNSPDKELIQKATRLMRDSQGSSFFKDQPLSLTTGYGLTGNTSLNKTILQFQSFMLARWENIERQIWRAGIKEKNYNKAFMSTLWLIVVAAAMEETIRRGTRAAVNLVTGDIQKEDSFIGNAALQAIQAIPIFGQLVSSLSYSSTPVPVIKTAEDVIAGGGAVFKGKKAATKARGLVRAVGAAGALAGVPGSSQAAQIINKGLKDNKGR